MAANTPQQCSLLAPDVQHRWLVEHVPHRIRASLTGLQLMAPWSLDWNLAAKVSPLIWRCFQNSIWEGRFAAMRWLIYFVGIQEGKGTAVTPHYKPEHDVWIGRFDGGSMVKPSSPEAAVLAALWKGCSQASSHPTEGTCHPDISAPKLAQGLKIIVEHLQATIYAAHARDLVADTLRVNDAP